MAADGNVASAARAAPALTTGRRVGCGMALGRLVRKLWRQSRMMLSTATSRPAATAAARYHQYDPLSYARNFDRSSGGLGDDDVSAQLYHHYTFASRFVLSTASRRQPQ